jgi:hypothetical protein
MEKTLGYLLKNGDMLCSKCHSFEDVDIFITQKTVDAFYETGKFYGCDGPNCKKRILVPTQFAKRVNGNVKTLVLVTADEIASGKYPVDLRDFTTGELFVKGPEYNLM